MLNFGIIGIGNAGNQIAALAAKELNIDTLCINSSQKDLDTLTGNITKILIGDSKGAGKNRSEAKLFVKANIKEIINNDEVKSFFSSSGGSVDKDFVFIVSSTGGGTGSGSAPMFCEILKTIYRKVNFIIVGVLPSINEALSAQVNTLEYFKELYNTCTDTPYILYDNDKMSDRPINSMMDGINNAVINDMRVLRGEYLLATKYSSIDEKDMTAILTTTGRILIAGAVNIKEKTLDAVTIDDLIVEDMKKNSHAEFNRDKNVHRLGVISILDDRVSEKFNDQLTAMQEFIGTPVETFTNYGIKTEQAVPNSVYVICSGLSRIDDRIDRISERIDEINKAQERFKERNDSLDEIDIAALNARKQVHHVDDGPSDETVNISNIFDKFGC